MDKDDKTNHKDLQEDTPVLDDEKTDISEKDETDYTGVFLSIGAGLGVSFGAVFDNLAMGIVIGTALGLMIGAVVNSINAKK